jgi:hypothetical protein
VVLEVQKVLEAQPLARTRLLDFLEELVELVVLILSRDLLQHYQVC